MKKNVIRLLFALVALLTSTGMLAENKLWIEQYGSDDDGNYVMAVMMDNDNTVSAIQFDLTIPETVSVVPVNGEYVYPNKLRLNNSQRFICAGNSSNTFFQCGVLAMRDDSFIGTEGPVAFFNIKGKTNTSQVDFKLDNIMMLTYSGTVKDDVESSWSGEVTVNPQLSISLSSESVIVVPGSEFKLPIVMDNSQNVQAFNMNIQLPEGFVLDKNNFTVTDRMKSADNISVYPKANNVYTLMVVDLGGAYVVRNTGKGEIFSCTVTAPSSIPEGSKIVISDIEASGDGLTYPGEGSTAIVIDASIAKANADAKIADLQKAYDDALATIATDCPLVADNFKGEAIQTAINDLTAQVAAAYADLTLSSNYDEVMAPAAVIESQIAKLVADAKAAQAAEVDRRDKNAAAYAASVAQIAVLQGSLDNAVNVIGEKYPDGKNQDAIDTVQGMIDAATNGAKSALDAVATTGEYNYEVAVADINAAIDNLLLAAEAAQLAVDKEAELQVKNKAAYEASLAAIAELQKNLTSAIELLKKDFPEYRNEEAEAAVQTEINNAKVAADAAFEGLKKGEEYKYAVDVEGINADIQALLDAAKAAKDKDETDKEAARQAANKAAYEADLAALDELNELYRNIVAEIQADYAPYENVSAELTVRNALDAAKAGVEKAYKAVEKEGNYNYGLDAEGLKASINKLLSDAKAAAEANRQKENLNAYNSVVEVIDALQAKLDATVKEIKADYAKYEDVEAEAAVQAQIVDLRTNAKKVYESVEKEGIFEFTFNKAPYEAAIDKLLTDAKAKAADAETIRQKDNLKAYNDVVAAIDALQAKLDATVKEIKADYAKYEDVEAEAAVQAQIVDLRANAKKAYEAVENEGNFEYTFDKAPYEASIEKLLADAKDKAAAADKEAFRQSENLKAYNNVVAAIDALQAKLDAAVAQIKSDYAEHEDVEAEASVQAQINALRDAALKAYEAVEKEGNFEFTFDKAPYEAAIDKLLSDAKDKAAAADAETARQKENLEAYNNVVAAIDALQAKFDATVAQIANDYAEYEDVEAEAAVQAQIKALREAALKAYEAVEKEGKFEYTFDKAPVEAAIEKLLADAKAKADAENAEALRKSENEKAYNAVIASLDELEARFKDVVAEIKDQYAAYEDADAENAVKETLDAYRDAANSAYDAVVEAGNYNFTFDAEGLANEIENLLADAKAKSEDRAAQNKAAYDAVIDELNALRAEKDAAVEKILAEYPDYDPTTESKDIDSAIDALISGAKLAYLAVEIEGEFDFTYDPEVIRNMINQMLENAEKYDSVDSIAAEVVAGNAYIFTLDGKQHQRPVQGEVNVIVRKNGERSKIFVK